jgi:hypothetical protein
MAQKVITNASVWIGGSDISNHVTSCTINYKKELIEDTAMGDSSRSRIGGLEDWSIDLEIQNDYADNNIDEILYGLVSAGVGFAVIIKPEATTISASNPAWTGTGIAESYSPIQGKVGDLATTSFTIMSCGTILERDITA